MTKEIIIIVLILVVIWLLYQKKIKKDLVLISGPSYQSSLNKKSNFK